METKKSCLNPKIDSGESKACAPMGHLVEAISSVVKDASSVIADQQKRLMEQGQIDQSSNQLNTDLEPLKILINGKISIMMRDRDFMEDNKKLDLLLTYLFLKRSINCCLSGGEL